ncbi:MAG: pyruvate carboxyltransferase, partial [Desulfobulbaceae bacterium]|nr:pyruvate carboxyltransferase [Desulfobulbaceae bacterium]
MQGLIDSTLREGEQAVGVRFSLVEKISIFRMLVQMGVEEIEIGLAAEYRQIADLCQYCRGSKKNSRIALWSRCRSDDIAAATR